MIMLWGKKDKKSSSDKEQNTAKTTARVTNIDDITSRAKLYFVSEQYDAAVKVYLKALESFPDDISLLYNLGMTYLALKNESEAASAFRRILELDPTNKEAQESLDKVLNYLP